MQQISVTDRSVGVLILIVGSVGVIAARSFAFLLPAWALVAVTLLLLEQRSVRGLAHVPQKTLPLAALLVLAAVSAAWSADPDNTLEHASIVLFILLQWHIVNYWVSVQPLSRIQHLCYWFAIAFSLGIGFLTLEVYGHQFIRRMLVENFGLFTPPAINHHYQVNSAGKVRIFAFELNRSVAAMNMLLWPALVCAANLRHERTRILFGSLLVGGVVMATASSSHETSKIAVITGLLVFAATLIRPRAAIYAVGGIWSLLVLAMVPFALFAYNHLELHTKPWLQPSARERIVIWCDVAERVIETPFLGVGARTANTLSAKGIASLKEPTVKRSATIARHAHNVYLQTWFELGLVGAILLLLAGLSVVGGVAALPAPVQPFALATFAVFMTEIASSWEIWQGWLASLFAVTAIVLLMGIRGRERPIPDSIDLK